MSDARRDAADDGIGIFDLRFNPNFRKRFAGYDKRDVELYIRHQEAIMTKIRLEKEQLERQVIRLRQQLATSKEQLTEADTAEADTAEADAAKAEAPNASADPEVETGRDEPATDATPPDVETSPDADKITDDGETEEAGPATEDAEPEAEDAESTTEEAEVGAKT